MGSASSFVGNVLANTGSGLVGDLAAQSLKAVGQGQSNQLAAAQLAAQQQEAYNEAQSKAAIQEQTLADSAAQTEALRQQQLAGALGKARAYFSAQGIDPDSGSAAVLQQSDSNNTAMADANTQQNLPK